MPERPRVYRTDALILTRGPLGEADSVFTLFSPEVGKFDAVARGVRKAQSRLRGHLEALSCVHVQLATGRTFDVITQVAPIDPFRALRDDLEKGALAQYVAEVVVHATAERHPQPELYALAMLTLSALAAGAPSHVCRYFEVHLLTLSGYDFHLDSCALCAGRLPPEGSSVAPQSGGLTCEACRGRGGPSVGVSSRAIKALRFARAQPLPEFMALRMDADLASELEAVLRLMVRQVVDREIRSARFLEQLRHLGPAPVGRIDEAQAAAEAMEAAGAPPGVH